MCYQVRQSELKRYDFIVITYNHNGYELKSKSASDFGGEGREKVRGMHRYLYRGT